MTEAKQTWAAQERDTICDIFEQYGPDAPTLCGDWTTRDLAAHLVVRENRPDAAIGIFVKQASQWTQKVEKDTAKDDYTHLVERVRQGPALLNALHLKSRRIDALTNTAEFFVHTEDILRAQPTWEPRELPTGYRDSLWHIARRGAAGFFRRVPRQIGIKIVRTDNTTEETKSYQVRVGESSLTISGPAPEILLYMYGRKEQAQVKISGNKDAISALKKADLSV